MDNNISKLNVIIGTQNIGPKYHFGDCGALISGAKHILEMGSNIFKFTLDTAQYSEFGGEKLSLARAVSHKIYKSIFDMNFKYYVMWCSSAAVTKQELTSQDRQDIYDEIYAVAEHLLSHYQNTGKVFLLGNWEGDWLLLGGLVDGGKQVDEGRCKMFAEIFNIRQRAVEAARNAVKAINVKVAHYIEVNRVVSACSGNANRLVNKVLPYVSVDMISYSCYDAIANDNLFEMLCYIEKNARFTDYLDSEFYKKVFVGEFDGYNDFFVSGDASEEIQVKNVLYVIEQSMKYGAEMILFWEIYNNYSQHLFYLIDTDGRENLVFKELKSRIAKLKFICYFYLSNFGRQLETKELTELYKETLHDFRTLKNKLISKYQIEDDACESIEETDEKELIDFFSQKTF